MPSSCARNLYVSCKCKQNLSLSETEHYFWVSSPDDKCQILLFIFPTRLFYCFPLWLMRFSLWGWLRKICILQWTRWDHHHKQYSYLDKIYLSAPPLSPTQALFSSNQFSKTPAPSNNFCFTKITIPFN